MLSITTRLAQVIVLAVARVTMLPLVAHNCFPSVGILVNVSILLAGCLIMKVVSKKPIYSKEAYQAFRSS